MGTETRIVAVAGGTGFVGGAIARELASRGHHVIVLSHRPPAARTRGSDRTGDFEFRQADVTRPDGLAAALAGVDALAISLAFRNSPIEAPRRGQTFEQVDAAGTEALVTAAVAAGVRRLVYVGRRSCSRRAKALVPGQMARRGGRPRQRSRVHDLPAQLDLWPRRPLPQQIPRYVPMAAVRAADRQRPPASGPCIRRRHRGARC